MERMEYHGRWVYGIINKGESELTGKISNQIKIRENKSASKSTREKKAKNG